MIPADLNGIGRQRGGFADLHRDRRSRYALGVGARAEQPRTQSRVVISCAALDAVKIIERAKLLGIPAVKLGTVGGDKLVLKTSAGECSAPVAALHAAWWNSLANAMA